jgi:hypothetical protein
MLEVERILMVDFASTQARAMEVAPLASHEGGQDVPSTGGDPHHCRHATNEVCLLALV